jgi:hypothetical protein
MIKTPHRKLKMEHHEHHKHVFIWSDYHEHHNEAQVAKYTNKYDGNGELLDLNVKRNQAFWKKIYNDAQDIFDYIQHDGSISEYVSDYKHLLDRFFYLYKSLDHTPFTLIWLYTYMETLYHCLSSQITLLFCSESGFFSVTLLWILF